MMKCTFLSAGIFGPTVFFICYRSRALTNVHEAILTDIMYPVDIVGRRWRYKTDGSKQTKVFIDAREKDKVESKLEGFSTIYKKLTGKEVTFGFMTKYVNTRPVIVLVFSAKQFLFRSGLECSTGVIYVCPSTLSHLPCHISLSTFSTAPSCSSSCRCGVR